MYGYDDEISIESQIAQEERARRFTPQISNEQGEPFILMKSKFAHGDYGYKLDGETEWNFGHGSMFSAKRAARKAAQEKGLI